MARGKKKANTEGVTIPNDPRAVFDNWYPLIRAAKVDFEEKQAELAGHAADRESVAAE